MLYVLPIVFALLVWWFTTGIILFLDGLPRRTFKYTFAGMSIITVIALWGLAATKDDVTLTGAYLAFLWGTLAWGWQEVSYYLGYVTGPRKQPCPDGCGGLRHFWHGVETSLWHELAVIASSLVVVALTWNGANEIGRWTFLIMWWMHQSAKLNVFFGVRNLNEEFLPEQLKYLASFLKKKPMNSFFPVSVTISTVITVLLFLQAFAPGASEFQTVGYLFLGFLMALAILEHWLLVLPLPGTLWDWSLKSRKAIKPVDIDVVTGFLGAGKTTYLRRLLATADPNVKTVVLVNDFGEVGIDGSLLGGQGADVVELPNGCVCCSLRGDLSRQIRATVARWAPDRLIVEPSGVAEVASLLRVLGGPKLRDVVKGVRVCTLIDAGGFLAEYGRLPSFFGAQATVAPLLIVNKTDRADSATLRTIEDTLRAINPAAAIVRATYGVVEAGEALPLPIALYDDEGDDHDHRPSFDSWNAPLPGDYDESAVRSTLERAAAGMYGDVRRIKGLAQVRDGWVAFDLAGGGVSVRAFAATAAEEPRVVAIGTDLDTEGLAAAFAACQRLLVAA